MKHKIASGVDPVATGVVFFAQCLDELLYEYTPVSFKPRVMCLLSLSEEVINIISQVELGAMKAARISSVIAELDFLLKGDVVAKEILPFSYQYYTRFEVENLSDLKLRVSLLRNILKSGSYIKALQNKIAAVAIDDRKKGEILSMARAWVSSVMSLGYSREFIAESCDIFYADVVEFNSSSDLIKFFLKFDLISRTYSAVFSSSEIIKRTGGSAKIFGIDLLDCSSPGSYVSNGQEIVLGECEVPVCVRGVKALDHFHAKRLAEKRLGRFSDMYAIFHHKRKIDWGNCAIVTVEGGQESKKVSTGVPGAKRSRDNLPFKASIKLAEALNGLSFSNRESFGKFMSVVRLHGVAQEATTAEAQLINLWTAMEVIIPRASDSKLQAVRRHIMPFLSFGYFDRMMFSLAGDLYRWDRVGVSKLLRRVNRAGLKQHQKLAIVLAGGENVGLRDELYLLTEGYKLLRYRCFELSCLLSSREKLASRLAEHETRVGWQIERIYRARNRIVHDGSTLSEVDALVECAHEYLDCFIGRFIWLCSNMKYVKTLDEALEFQSHQYELWKRGLYSSESVTSDNVIDVCCLH